MYMYNYIEMARVTGVPMSFLLTRGQSIKVFSQILRKARQRNLLVPNLKVSRDCDTAVHGVNTLLSATCMWMSTSMTAYAVLDALFMLRNDGAEAGVLHTRHVQGMKCCTSCHVCPAPSAPGQKHMPVR